MKFNGVELLEECLSEFQKTANREGDYLLAANEVLKDKQRHPADAGCGTFLSL